MSTLIVTEFVTLDGVMEAPGGEPTHPHSGWVGDYFNDAIGAYKQDETLAADALLIGRVTYESFAGAWPTYEGEMAEKMNTMPKYVVSSTLTDPTWPNTTVTGADPVAAVAQATAAHDGIVLVAGSATLVHALIEAGLVDELRLMVFPVSIGDGLRVFPAARTKVAWSLDDTVSFANGVRVDIYHPA